MDNERDVVLEAEGTLYFCPVRSGNEGIIGLSEDASLRLMMEGLGDCEVGLTVREPATCVNNHTGEGVRLWAWLVTMTVDGRERLQVRIPAEAAQRLERYGFRDLGSVRFAIDRLSHTAPARLEPAGDIGGAWETVPLPF